MAEQDASQLHGEVKTEELEILGDIYVAEYIEKYNRYKAEYSRRIKAKYFSKKAPNGADVFEKETSIGDEIIKSSRVPCTEPFIESFINTEDSNSLLGPGAEASASTPACKTLPRKAN